jgi:hypothetical protein
MSDRLTPTEIQAVQRLMQGYAAPEVGEITSAIATLEQHHGDLDASFNALWVERVDALGNQKSLWQVTIQELRKEICGDEGFRGKVKEYSKNPGSAPLLTGVIVSLVGIAGAHGLPLDPAIATIIVLYILKIGLSVFCEYTEPPKPNNP